MDGLKSDNLYFGTGGRDEGVNDDDDPGDVVDKDDGAWIGIDMIDEVADDCWLDESGW